MDKFVIRQPRAPKQKADVKAKDKKKTQIRLEELPRVVVVEHIHQAKSVLSVPDQRVDEVIKALQSLDKCTPSKDVLLETKIGHLVNAHRRHDCEEVRNLARKILKKWKQFYRNQKNRQPIEVRSDAKSESFRFKARKLLAEALFIEIGSSLAESIERTVYMKENRCVGISYRRRIRAMCIKLKNDEELRVNVHSKEITSEQLYDHFVRTLT